MKTIFIDFGGTVSREQDAFEEITKKSGNDNLVWSGPSSWDKIRCVGNKNYFEKIQVSFFRMLKYYPESCNVISSFCGKEFNPRTKTFLLFDNKPRIEIPPQDILKEIVFSFNALGGNVNGIYIAPDKLSFIKKNGGGIAIEDDPRVAISLALSNVSVLLMLRKWNHVFCWEMLKSTTSGEKFEKLKKNIYIVEDWVDAKKTIDSILKMGDN